MMNKPIPPISDEHLVAYLDGELEAEGREQVEAQLASDEVLRQRLARLERSWNLLDHLPATDLSPEFAQTTVTLVAGRLKHRTGLARWQTWVVGLAAGFAVVAMPLWVHRQRQLRDLPVIQNLELYRVADSVQFLQMLEEEGLFVEDVEDVL